MKRSESMAPVVEVELDKTRHLLLDVNALASIEEKIPGVNTLAIDFWANLTATRLRVVLWAALLHEDAKLTLEDVIAMMKGRNLGEVTRKILEAYGLSKPEPKAEDEEKSDPQNPEATPSQST